MISISLLSQPLKWYKVVFFPWIKKRNGYALLAWYSFFKTMSGMDGQKVMQMLFRKWHSDMQFCLKTEMAQQHVQ